MMKTPVLILSGFLGSGKTTLLLQLIREAGIRGLNPCVLMNELGKQDVDGQIVADAAPGMRIEKLMDGCICCNKKSEVAASLSNLLLMSPDVIFIELTGVANPEEIADCLAEPQLISKVYLKQIITILDGENALDYNSILASDKNLVHTLRRQIEVADLLIVNKTDLVKPQHLPKIEKAARKQNQQAAIYFTTHSRIDMALVFDNLKPIMNTPQTFNRFQGGMGIHAPQRIPTLSMQEHEHHELSFSRVQSITLPYQTSQPMKQKQLEKFLLHIGPKLLRAKGYLTLAKSDGVVLMQYAAQRITWESTVYTDAQYVVFIGIGLDAQRLTAKWEQLSRT